MQNLLDSIPFDAGLLRFDVLGSLVLATLLGGAIGWEREFKGKPAGLRTNLLICVGSALLTVLSLEFSGLGGEGAVGDPTRIAAQIVTGIGFIGAGTILQARGSVHGLTTAATVWVVAAIGMAVGGGAYVVAVGATVLVLVVLWPLEKLEAALERRRRIEHLVVRVRDERGVIDRVAEVLRGSGLQPELEYADRDPAEDRLTLGWRVSGGAVAVAVAQAALLDESGVLRIAVR